MEREIQTQNLVHQMSSHLLFIFKLRKRTILSFLFFKYENVESVVFPKRINTSVVSL